MNMCTVCTLSENKLLDSRTLVTINSCGYYKFQVVIGAAANQDLHIEVARKCKFMVFNLVPAMW